MAKDKPAAKGKEAAPAPAAAVLAKPVKGKVAAVVAPVVPEKEKEKKKEKRSQKERPKSEKKHAKVQVWKLYDVKSGLKRKNEECPRCGSGTFLAKFKNRKYCGKCGWSQIENK